MFKHRKKESEPGVDMDKLKQLVDDPEKFIQALKSSKGSQSWGTIDLDKASGNKFSEEAEKNNGVVRVGESVTAVRPNLPPSFHESRRRRNSGHKQGTIKPDTLQDDVAAYFCEVEDNVGAFLNETTDLGKAMEDITKLTPLEWSAKYALPLLLTAGIQHFAMVEVMRDEKFRNMLIAMWNDHVEKHPHLKQKGIRNGS